MEELNKRQLSAFWFVPRRRLGRRTEYVTAGLILYNSCSLSIRPFTAICHRTYYSAYSPVASLVFYNDRAIEWHGHYKTRGMRLDYQPLRDYTAELHLVAYLSVYLLAFGHHQW